MNDRIAEGKVVNQRMHERVDYEVSVDMESESNFFTGLVRNISEGGLFVLTEKPLPIGSEVSIRFTVPTYPTPVTARTIVRWVRSSSAGSEELPAGMGVQFVGLPPDVVTAINRFISKVRDSDYYDD